MIDMIEVSTAATVTVATAFIATVIVISTMGNLPAVEPSRAFACPHRRRQVQQWGISPLLKHSLELR
jgi:hypothetical protein